MGTKSKIHMTDLSSKLSKSAGLMLLTRILVKSLGLVSSLILVRLLLPSDFGVVAIAMSIYAFIELFGRFGFSSALIQKSHPKKEDYDVVFTYNFIFGLIAAITLIMSASALSDFFNDQRLVDVLSVISLMFFLQGIKNVKIIDFQRNMDFMKELKLQVIPKLISFFITLFLAWYLETYWALVYGMLALSLLNIAYSYYVFPYRASFRLKGGGALFHYSKWLMINNLFYYLNNRALDLIVGKVISTKAAGLYSISLEMANIPVSEVAAPINKAAFPAYSKEKNSPDKLVELYYQTIAMITFLSLPICLGLFSVAEVFVPVVLGEKWMETIGIIKYIAIGGFFTSLVTNNGYVLMAIGKPYITTLVSGVRFLLLLLLLLILLDENDISSPALAIMLSASLNMLFSYYLLKKYLPVKSKRLLKAIYRPLVGSIVMLMVVYFTKTYLQEIDMLASLQLLTLVLLGGGIYAAVIILLWLVAGQPKGIEKLIMQKLNLVNNERGL